MSAVIETENLSKTYEGAFKGQDVHALKNLTLRIDSGEIFGYLGPNGSGKTTTIKLLLGLIFPTEGKMKVLGRSDIAAHEVRRNIGYLPEGAYYPDFLRGEEVLKYYGQLYGMGGSTLRRRIDEVLEVVGMTRARKRLVRGYSKGMRQRIGLAQALISDPQVLILDEPTTGLDPIARKEIRDILLRLRNEGKTLMISSHELLEVEVISDRVGILFEGVLQTVGTIEELLTDRDIVVQVEAPSQTAVEQLRAVEVNVEDRVNKATLLRVPNNLNLYTVLDLCKQHNVVIKSIAPRRETLEELFVRVVGQAGAAKGKDLKEIAANE
ncbi:MAG: ABC transporter ATP-binding protein [Candidatus Hydrogenedentes bacterium]|nr:ABC transporter ATP-binding protein [Candidatus Hydrogenedentota bacterium]